MISSPRGCCGTYPDEKHKTWCRAPKVTKATVIKRKVLTDAEKIERSKQIAKKYLKP